MEMHVEVGRRSVLAIIALGLFVILLGLLNLMALHTRDPPSAKKTAWKRRTTLVQYGDEIEKSRGLSYRLERRSARMIIRADKSNEDVERYAIHSDPCHFASPKKRTLVVDNCQHYFSKKISVRLPVWRDDMSDTRIYKDADELSHNNAMITASIARLDMVTLESRDEFKYNYGLITGNRVEYAQKHGYSYHFFNESLLQGQHTKLSKYEAVKQLLHPSFLGEQWVVWIDSDALITNRSISFERDIIERYAHSETDFIVARDIHLTPINTGVFLFRNTEWTRQFLDRIIIEGPRLIEQIRARKKDFKLVDQPIVAALLQDLGLANMNPKSNRESIEVSNKISIIPTRSMNSFCRTHKRFREWDKTLVEVGLWHPGDFIAHFTGADNANDRYQTLVSLVSFAAKHEGDIEGMREAPNPCLAYRTGTSNWWFSPF